MPIQGNARKRINEKEAFVLWYELGTLEKTQTHMKIAGIVNPRTGKPFSIMAIWTAAMRWVVLFHEESREYYKKAGAEFAFSDLQWEEWLVQKAMYALGQSSRKRFFRWIEKNGFEKYDYIYANSYGMEPTHSRPVPE